MSTVVAVRQAHYQAHIGDCSGFGSEPARGRLVLYV